MLRSLSARNEFVGFLIAGGLAALANLGSRWMFSSVLSYPMAIVAAYAVGMITAFVLMRSQVFGSGGGGLAREAGAFAVINVLAMAQTLLVSLGVAYYVLPWLGWNWQRETVAHAVGVAVPIVSSYYGHKHWTFDRGGR